MKIRNILISMNKKMMIIQVNLETFFDQCNYIK